MFEYFIYCLDLISSQINESVCSTNDSWIVSKLTSTIQAIPGSENGLHFNSKDHSGLSDVELHILDFIHANPVGRRSKQLRDLIEFTWIQWLHSNAPVGLNVMDPTTLRQPK